MRAINYKSDFDFIPKLKDRNGKEVRFPDCDWEAVLWVSNKANNYKVSRKGEQYTNCFVEENGDVHFVVNGHHLGIGVLKWDLHVALPNEIYPDGLQHLCWPESLDIELVAGAGDCPTTAELEAMLPYIKGEPLTYEDFTPEQIAELQKPATDAAASVSELETNIQETEALRKDAEQTRISNENSRTSAENDRVRDENIRKANETSRQSDETSRQSNETARVEAETARAEEFAAWQGEIDSKADRSELSNVLAEKLDDGAILKERGTGEVMYPQTLASLVQTAVGDNVDEALERLFASPSREFIAQCEATGLVVYNRNTGYFELNGLTDITTAQMRVIMRESSGANYLCDYCHSFGEARTFLPVRNSRGSWGHNAFYAFARCANLEVLDFDNSAYVGISGNSFSSCFKLREIRNGKLITNANSKDALNLPNLESFTVRISSDFNLSNASKVTYDSIEYMVSNAINTSPIIITLHPDAYARVTDELFALAAEKSITIAST